ncbi:hypothetical protein [Spirosoma jeollabukense]
MRSDEARGLVRGAWWLGTCRWERSFEFGLIDTSLKRLAPRPMH